MSIRVQCEKCGSVLKIKEELAGTKGKCPKCKHTLLIPTLPESGAGKSDAATPDASSADAAVARKKPENAAPAKASPAADAPAASERKAAEKPTAAAEKPAAAPAPAPAATPPEAESPPVVEKKSAVVEKVAAAENSEVAEKPPVVESPAAVEKPVVAEKNVATEKPAAAEKPVSVEKAAAAEKPAKAVKQPAAVKAPSPSVEDAEPKSNGESKLRKSSQHDMPVVEAKASEPAEPPAANKASEEDEFDPAAFLMDGPKPKPVPAAAPPTAGRGRPAPAKSPAGERLELSDDDDDTQPGGRAETVTPPPRSTQRSAAELAGAMLSGAATASSAKDLLARSMQDSRARASKMPSETKEPRTDYVALLKEVFKSFGPQIAGVVVACVVLYMSMNYMLGDGVEVPDLAPVYGKVTLEGKPLAGVSIYFKVIGDKTGEYFKKNPDRLIRDATAITGEDGSYELMYLAEEGIKGAVIGKNRVYVVPNKIEDFARIPGQYTQPNSSTIIEDVKSGGGEINIKL